MENDYLYMRIASTELKLQKELLIIQLKASDLDIKMELGAKTARENRASESY